MISAADKPSGNEILVLTADRGHARLFSIAYGQEQLQEISDLVNADARMPAHSLVSDRQGRVLKRVRGSRAALGRQSLVDESARRFAHNVGAMLAKRLHRHRARSLYLLADPEFLGMLRRDLRARQLAIPMRSIAKNVTRASANRIRTYMPKHLWPRRIMGVRI